MVDSMRAGTQQSSYYDIILEWHEPIEHETGLEYWDDHYALNLIGHLERLGIRQHVRLYLVTHCKTVKDMRDRVQYLRGCRYDGGKKSMLDELEAVVRTTERLDLSMKLGDLIDRSSEINGEDKVLFKDIVSRGELQYRSHLYRLSNKQLEIFHKLEKDASRLAAMEDSHWRIDPLSEDDPWETFTGNILQYLYQTHGPGAGRTGSKYVNTKIYPAAPRELLDSDDRFEMHLFVNSFPDLMKFAERTGIGLQVSNCDGYVAECIQWYVSQSSLSEQQDVID